MSEQRELKRGIKSWQVTFIALGGIVGSVYFLGVGLVVKEIGPASVIAYLLVGLMLFGIMISFAELIVNLPRRGTFVAYSQEFLGDSVAAGIGWSYWLAWAAFVPSEAIAGGIMLDYFVPGSILLYSAVIMLLITIINLAGVTVFARIESTLSCLKVMVIGIFIVAALGIWLGIWGNADGFVGFSVMLDNPGETLGESIFPNGVIAVFVGMTLIFSTVGGTEIVGITAGEAQDPEHSVPKACRSVVYRLLLIYIIPVVLIVLLLPTEQSGIDGSVFSLILDQYGLHAVAWIFTFIVVIAAFSCGNTAFYASVRDLYSLATSGLAPKTLTKLDKNQSPRNAVFATLAFSWVVFILASFAGESKAYEYLMIVTGFAGAICWFGILLSQMKYRRLLRKRGYTVNEAVKAPVKVMAVPYIALIILIVGLAYLAIGLGSIVMFIVSICSFCVPAGIFSIRKKITGKKLQIQILEDETSFDEKYPEIK